MSVATMSLVVEDFSGSLRRRARGIPGDATVGELVSALSKELALPENDVQGRPVTYGARARGLALNEADRLDEVVDEGETLTLVQQVTAG